MKTAKPNGYGVLCVCACELRLNEDDCQRKRDWI